MNQTDTLQCLSENTCKRSGIKKWMLVVGAEKGACDSSHMHDRVYGGCHRPNKDPLVGVQGAKDPVMVL